MSLEISIPACLEFQQGHITFFKFAMASPSKTCLYYERNCCIKN